MCQTCTKPNRKLFSMTPRKHPCSKTAASPQHRDRQFSADSFSQGPTKSFHYWGLTGFSETANSTHHGVSQQDEHNLQLTISTLASDSRFRVKATVFAMKVCPQWLPNILLLAVALCIAPRHMSPFPAGCLRPHLFSASLLWAAAPARSSISPGTLVRVSHRCQHQA